MNLPNSLSLLRICLSFVFLSQYLNNNTRFAIVIFFVASITDVIDGYIARKFNLITDMGKLLDPMADKTMTICVIMGLTIKGIITPFILWIILFKEMLFVTISVACLQKKVIVYSLIYGKLTSVLFNIGIVFIFFKFYLLGNITLYCGLFCALIGGFQYALKFFDNILFWRK